MEHIDDTLLFEAVISPHRSLSRRGLRVLLGAICLLCGINAIVFVQIGAWPVGGFTGVELLLAALLFRLNAHAARGSELVMLSESGLRVIRTDPRGRRRALTLSPAWLSVTLEERHGRVPALILGARDRRLEIAIALGEAEKRDLAEALRAALHRWRNPVFDNPPAESGAIAQGDDASALSGTSDLISSNTRLRTPASVMR